MGCAVGQRSRRKVLNTVVGKVFIGFIANVIETLHLTKLINFLKGLGWIYSTSGIVGRNGDDRTGSWGNSCGDRFWLELITAIRGYTDRLTTDHTNGHFMIEVVGRIENDFIAW